jgi:CRISPR-associated endonuclease Cas2
MLCNNENKMLIPCGLENPVTQESVFVANLDDELAGRMRERVAKLIDEQWDRVHIFELCQSCANRTRVFGSGEIIKDREFYVI